MYAARCLNSIGVLFERRPYEVDRTWTEMAKCLSYTVDVSVDGHSTVLEAQCECRAVLSMLCMYNDVLTGQYDMHRLHADVYNSHWTCTQLRYFVVLMLKDVLVPDVQETNLDKLNKCYYEHFKRCHTTSRVWRPNDSSLLERAFRADGRWCTPGGELFWRTHTAQERMLLTVVYLYIEFCQ